MSTPRLTVWYNSKCPVCDVGIKHQRGRLHAAVAAGDIAFRDINFEPDALAAYGVTNVDDIRRRLHAVNSAGLLLVGADAAVAILRATPGEGWLATLLGAPGIIQITRLCYDGFADLLFAWNKRAGRW